MLRALIHRAIRKFEAQADYDAGYLHEVTDASVGLTLKFQKFVKLNHHHKVAPNDALQTARLATMTTEDCGPCLQLCIGYALQSGMDRDRIEAAVRTPDRLPTDLQTVHAYALATATNAPEHAALGDRVEAAYGRDVRIELAMAIATSRVYPALKRGLGHAKACALMEFDFDRAA